MQRENMNRIPLMIAPILLLGAGCASSGSTTADPDAGRSGADASTSGSGGNGASNES
jgi:hypothetical protein